MNDAELVRDAAESLRDYAGTSRGHDSDAAYEADRLTALAAELDGGVIVPREQLGDWHTALKGSTQSGAAFVYEQLNAMLDASEAK